ncbi:glyoxylase-like metal-dependent hydrolase (beta-lactamase superfamily II) [Pseudomonas duriflava]|uniref:Glyoxylase-like metal-dependent hydrolase (Beta-lactamase superfamily II) n=1 Tax=Pseudomonas duriflava TaxID=459528 RepID=A0A562Q2D3_9PSED|nr:MBL fold metallo-hydrolase [Pseudomonas duriflava]TWI50835.1 glyoxylase-like metal-dependent hydrolase (beta-lactamase superfamily II) [Pseudomonas duriflava]
MRVHHLDCGCMCPWGGALFDGFSKGLRGHLVCHCLLVETDRHGLVLIDTGFGERDVHAPYKRLSSFFIKLNNIQFDRRYTAVEQVRKLGFQPQDVRHIVLTHLDFDHAGGLEDFPGATVHVLQREIEAAKLPHGFIAKNRYRLHQWDQVKQWQFYKPHGEQWYGFSAVRDLEGLPPEILLIPLAGHTWGHAGVAIQGPRGWLLHAGDAYFYREEVGQQKRACPPGLRFYQTLMEASRDLRMRNQQRLRELSVLHAGEVELFCSHDAKELERYQNLNR